MIKIQFQDHDGNWRTVMTTDSNSQLITARMRELKKINQIGKLEQLIAMGA